MNKAVIFLLLITSWVARSQYVATVAGSTIGYADGPGLTAKFNWPQDICSDNLGNLYVADGFNAAIRKITPDGEVSTFAGGPPGGDQDGQGTAAQFSIVSGICFSPDGNFYVADINNHKIKKITPDGYVSTFAGSTPGFHNAAGTSAQFANPRGVCADAQGNLYVADYDNHCIRKITPGGQVSTLAGSNNYGNVDGVGTAARFTHPTKVCADPSGNIFVSDAFNGSIRKITPGGVVSTVATGLYYPEGVASDPLGNIFASDSGAHVIKKIATTGEVTVYAGSSSGYADGVASEAQFAIPLGICFAPNGYLYVVDKNNLRIRRITETLGQNEQSSPDFRLYPNPANSYFMIESGNLSPGAELRVLDALGQTVWIQKLTATENKIDTNGFQKGVYFVSVSAGGTESVRKIIIQ